MEWINIAWAWVVEHITPLLTTANLTLLASVIWTLFKQKRNLLDNTASGKELKQTLNAIKLQSASLDEQTAGLGKLKEVVQELKDVISIMTVKADAELDILHTVYMAQNLPSDAKQVIGAFYSNARYAETQQRAEIVKRVEELQARLAEMTEKAGQEAEAVKKIVGEKPEKPATVNLK